MFRSTTCDPGTPSGIGVHSVPDSLQRNDVVSTMLVAGILLLLLVVGQGRHRLYKAAGNFFFPSNNHQSQPASDIASDVTLRLALYLLLVVSLSLVGYIFIGHFSNVESLLVSPDQLLLIFFILALMFVVLKWLTYHLVHWTFFSREQRQSWHRHSSFLFSVESLLVFPLVSVSVFLDLRLHWLALSLIFVLLFVKILLSFKVRSIFFPRFRGTFHFFVYLCALEITPYLVLWAIMTLVTSQLALHFLG